MLVVLLTLWTLTAAQASTMDISNCKCVKQPNIDQPNFNYKKYFESNGGKMYYIMVPPYPPYTKGGSPNVKAVDFEINLAPVNNNSNYTCTITATLNSGEKVVFAHNEEVFDLGNGKTLVKSEKGSPIPFDLNTVILWYSKTCLVYSACSPNGSDKQNRWLFTKCKSRLSDKERTKVKDVYRKYRAEFLELESPKYC